MLKSNARGSENKLGPDSGISGTPYCIDQILVCSNGKLLWVTEEKSGMSQFEFLLNTVLAPKHSIHSFTHSFSHLFTHSLLSHFRSLI
jgi:hypothetical protein